MKFMILMAVIAILILIWMFIVYAGEKANVWMVILDVLIIAAVVTTVVFMKIDEKKYKSDIKEQEVIDEGSYEFVDDDIEESENVDGDSGEKEDKDTKNGDYDSVEQVNLDSENTDDEKIAIEAEEDEGDKDEKFDTVNGNNSNFEDTDNVEKDKREDTPIKVGEDDDNGDSSKNREYQE